MIGDDMNRVTIADAQIFAASLKILSTFSAGKSECRFYLQSVFFEVDGPNDRMHMTATDGNQLATIELPIASGATFTALLGTEEVKAMLSKLERCRGECALKHYADDPHKPERAQLVLEHGFVDHLPSHWTLDGRFPDWRRVMPAPDCDGRANPSTRSMPFDVAILCNVVKGFDNLYRALGLKTRAANGLTWLRVDGDDPKRGASMLLSGGDSRAHMRAVMMGQRTK